MRRARRGGEMGGSVMRKEGYRTRDDASFGSSGRVVGERLVCFEATGGMVAGSGVCCALQQDGRLWGSGEDWGQWLQRGGLDGCSACRHDAAPSVSINIDRQSRAAKRCRRLFMSTGLDVWAREMACGKTLGRTDASNREPLEMGATAFEINRASMPFSIDWSLSGSIQGERLSGMRE